MKRSALITSDLEGQLWMDRLAQSYFGCPVSEPNIAPVDWAGAFHCYDPITRMPLPTMMIPGYRALAEGDCEADVLVAPPGRKERVLHMSAKRLHSADGAVVGCAVACRDITKDWLERVGATDVDYSVSQCPCEAWQVEAPVGTPVDWIADAVREHMQACVVLAASRMTALSAAGGAALGAIFAILAFLQGIGADDLASNVLA